MQWSVLIVSPHFGLVLVDFLHQHVAEIWTIFDFALDSV